MRVYYKQNQTWFDSPDCDPPFFIGAACIGMSDGELIFKHNSRSFKRDLMLLAIDFALMRIPFKSHG
jgi:hypothetical protein